MDLEYSFENLKTTLKGGVRRWVLIIFGISILSIFPLYYGGIWAAGITKNIWIDTQNKVTPKSITVNDYTVSQTQIVELANGETALYATVNNGLNTEVGFNPWVYTLQVLDAQGVVVFQEKRTSYLLPGETKYVIASDKQGRGRRIAVVKERETVTEPYNPFASETAKEPDISVPLSEIQPTADPNQMRIRALFRNNTNFYINNVDVTYIIRDSRQAVVGIGTYAFNGFESGTEREILVDYPMPKEREARTVDIRFTVNYLDKNSILFK